jgi:hypothetical protein
MSGVNSNGVNGGLANALNEADLYFAGVGSQQLAQMQVADSGYTSSSVTANQHQGGQTNGNNDDLLIL